MSKLKKHRFKQWWQILNDNGHTVDQFLSETQADDYIKNYPPPIRVIPFLWSISVRVG